MLWVPGYALYYLLTEEGTLSERLRKGVTPVIRPRLEAMMAEEKAKLAIRDASDVEINMAEAEGTALVPESLWLKALIVKAQLNLLFFILHRM